MDFSSAFDTIPRDRLLQKLLSHNISGRFFNIIRNIYTNDKACIKVDRQHTEPFDISRGVRQGCVLSPLLFNIFIAGLIKELDLNQAKTMIGGYEIACIAWADDLVLVSENELTLQKMLNTLESYCDENKLQINTDKTKCMTFNKTGRLMRKTFFIKGVPIENVRSYKYLGFLVTPSGEIRSGLQDLRDRALKGFMKLKTTLGNVFRQDIVTTLTLIDSIIKPVLLYLSDFWGCLKLPKNNPIENLHMMMCKQLLGVQKQTTNHGVLLELGRTPLYIQAAKQAIKNWERIRRGKANVILMASCKENLNNWDLEVMGSLQTNGMLCFYQNTYDNKPMFIYKKAFQNLSDQFHQNAFESIKGNRSKLRTYAVFKKEIGFEKYLYDVKNPIVRAQVTKFRLSNHKLAIETGRHKNIPKELRFCPFCTNHVETETHFLFYCPMYKMLRETLTKDNSGNFRHYTDDQKLQQLLINTRKMTVTYIRKALDLREFLLAKHKMQT